MNNELIAKHIFHLSLLGLLLVIISFSMIFNGFKSKKATSIYIGGLMGVGGFVLSIISTIKAINNWKLISESNIAVAKRYLYATLAFNSIYDIILIIVFAFVIWLFIGYRHGL